jgi:5'-deoxynucleotidase YfbR-like HD superfamily hydrolase
MTDLDQPFLFELPEFDKMLSQPARTTLYLGLIANHLAQVDRTRVEHETGRPENDAEHGFMLGKVAPELAMMLYPDLDAGLVSIYANVHDDVEAYVGDTPTDFITQKELDEKKQREARAAEKLYDDFKHDAPFYAQKVKEYEAQKILEARLVRVVDKMMVLVIHFSNDGKIVKQNYTHETSLKSGLAQAEKLAKEYPEFIDLINVRRELSQFLADSFLGSGK